MTLEVAKALGVNCITLEQGEAVFEKIYPELKSGREVHLDFDGVRIFASPFFNSAIGRLLQDIDPVVLNRLLRIERLSPTGLEVLRHVIENSKQYYSSGPARSTLDKFLSDEEKS